MWRVWVGCGDRGDNQRLSPSYVEITYLLILILIAIRHLGNGLEMAVFPSRNSVAFERVPPDEAERAIGVCGHETGRGEVQARDVRGQRETAQSASRLQRKHTDRFFRGKNQLVAILPRRKRMFCARKQGVEQKRV